MPTLERIPEEKQILAKVLFDAGRSFAHVKRQTKLANDTLYAIKRNNEYSQTTLEEFKKRLPYKAYRLADDVLDLITLEDIKKAPLNIKMMTFGIAIDKARDMEGSNRPQFNIVNIVNECKTTRDKLEEQLKTIDTQIQSRQTMVISNEI